ncbi:MAG: hypothetical protein HY755_01990 [Nitrospirae bacterium]|nr:hypothetical protein [Nitrospirota bacterium]
MAFELTAFDQILAAKRKDPNSNTSALEKQIDEMVYGPAYPTYTGRQAAGRLTPDEIAIVEGKE